MRTVIGAFLAAVLLGPSAFADSPGTWNGLPDRFQIDTGYFRLNANTVLRYNGAQGSGDDRLREGPRRRRDGRHVLGGRDLAGGPASPAQARPTRGLNRDRGDFTLAARLHLGRRDLQRRLSASTSTGTRHPRRLLPLRHLPQRPLRDRPDDRRRLPLARTRGSRRRAPSAGPAGPRAARSTRARAPAASPAPWAATRTAWLAKRLVARADFLYIKVKPEDSEASVTDWRARRRTTTSPQRRRRRPVQVQQVQLRPRDPGQRAGRRADLRGRPGLPDVPVLIRLGSRAPRQHAPEEPGEAARDLPRAGNGTRGPGDEDALTGADHVGGLIEASEVLRAGEAVSLTSMAQSRVPKSRIRSTSYWSLVRKK